VKKKVSGTNGGGVKGPNWKYLHVGKRRKTSEKQARKIRSTKKKKKKKKKKKRATHKNSKLEEGPVENKSPSVGGFKKKRTKRDVLAKKRSYQPDCGYLGVWTKGDRGI